VKLTSSVAALAALYAIPGTPLAAHAPAVEQAMQRAAQVRAGDIQPPGNWTTGAQLPRSPDGNRMNTERGEVPTTGPRMLWVGGNGGG
jgi:hypothetical protein